MAIIPESLTVGHLLQQRYPFNVPKYQRAYAWGRDEVLDFINDVLTIFEARKTGLDRPSSHFLGGIVAVKRTVASTNTGSEYELVDGQQRMATISLTLQVVAAGFGELSKVASAENDLELAETAQGHMKFTRDQFLVYQDMISLDVRPRLNLSQVDRDFFNQLRDGLQPEPSRESHRLMQWAMTTVGEKLILRIVGSQDGGIQEKVADLLLMRSVVLDCCNVILIVSDEQMEAYRLFSVLNDRGLTLSDGDLLRAFTLELTENYPDIQAAIEGAWAEVLASSPSYIDGFLRAYFSSVVGKKAAKRDLYDAYVNAFFAGMASPLTSREEALKVQKRVVGMKDELVTFDRLASGEWPFEPPTASVWKRNRLQRLIQVLGHTLCIPLLMSIAKNCTEEVFSAVVVGLEKFVFRYINIVGEHPDPLAERYYRHSLETRNPAVGFRRQVLEDELRSMMTERAGDEVFKTRLVSQLVYTRSSPRRKLIVHFMSTIEDHLQWLNNGANGSPQPDETSNFDLDTLTIEHIYPKNSPDQDPDLEEVKNHIGNLTCLSERDNNARQNDSFESKKSAYARSSFALNRSLAALPDWNSTQFVQRQSRLQSWACKVFRI